MEFIFILAAILVLLAAILVLFVWHEAILAIILGSWAWLIGIPLLTWMRSHPWQTVAYVVGYLLTGAIWSLIKWWICERDRFREAKEHWIKYSGGKTWEQERARQKTLPTSHKDDFLWWIGFWPFSLAYTLLHDPVKRIYLELQNVYQRITDKVWEG